MNTTQSESIAKIRDHASAGMKDVIAGRVMTLDELEKSFRDRWEEEDREKKKMSYKTQ